MANFEMLKVFKEQKEKQEEIINNLCIAADNLQEEYDSLKFSWERSITDENPLGDSELKQRIKGIQERMQDIEKSLETFIKGDRKEQLTSLIEPITDELKEHIAKSAEEYQKTYEEEEHIKERYNREMESLLVKRFEIESFFEGRKEGILEAVSGYASDKQISDIEKLRIPNNPFLGLSKIINNILVPLNARDLANIRKK